MKPVLPALLILCTPALFAQSEKSDFTSTGRGVATTFSTDYHAAGINPSNLGFANKFEGKHFTMGFAETGISLYSEALEKKEFWNSVIKWNQEELTEAEKMDAASRFVSRGVAINADVMAFGFAFQKEKIGGFAFQVRDRFSWYSNFNQNASEIIFLGFNAPYFDKKYNEYEELMTDAQAEQYPDSVRYGSASSPKLFSDLLDGTRINMNWYREFNFSYGRKMYDGEKVKVYLGAGVKYLQGIAIADIVAEGGKFNGFSAISPGFGINYGDSAMKANPSTVTSSGSFPASVGSGFGADAGVTLEFFEKLKIGLAVTDVGSITWDGNVYEADDNTLDSITTGGFDSYNIFAEAGEIMADNRYFTWRGSNSRTVELPAMARLGASFKFNDKFEAGADAVLPVNDAAGNIQNAAVNVGLDFSPARFITLSTGFTAGGNYNANIPLGVVFNVGDGAWEAGAATRDVMVFLTQDKPTVSVAFGFLRFRM